MANPTITINATGITVSGPLIAGEPLAVTASGLSLPEDAALTLALSSRAPNALLASCVLAESEETPGTWTGTLETASRQMAVYFATAAADDTRPAVLELVETTTRDSLALLVTSIRNSALIPSSSPCAVAPVYLPIPGPPGPPGQGGDPYDQAPLMDGGASAGTSDDYARGDHRHPSDTAKVNKSGDTMTGSLTVPGMVANEPGLQVSGTNSESVQVGAGDGEGYAVFSDGSGHSVSIGAGGPTEFNVADGDDDFDVALPKNNGTLALQEGIAPAFSSSSTYAVGDYVTYEGLLYKCTTAVSTAGAWNAANWTEVAVTNEIGGGGAPKNVWYVGSTTGSGGTISGSTTTGDFVLAAGNVVVVKMSYGVNATSATLDIDGTGAKPISTRSGSTTFPQYFWSNGQAIAFVYDGTYYIPCSLAPATVYNAWGLTSLSSTVNNDETKAATPKAVNTRAPKDSPAFTGTPTAPTAAAGTNTTQIATTAFVQTAIAGKADAAAIRYSFASPTPTVSGTTATVACEDRAINDFTVATGVTSLTITPPAAVANRARDFFCRVTLTDSSLPTVTLSSGTIDIGATEVAGMTQGVNLLMFTEIVSGHWLASRRSAS